MTAIYLDNNATTPLDPEVLEAMLPYLGTSPAAPFGNPASAHRFGRHARRGLEEARETVAALLDARPDEVVFTSGATEANNWAVSALAGKPPGQVLCSAVEHPSVLEPVRRLAERGFEVAWLPVDAVGQVRLETVQEVAAGARLAALMLANNETGAVQPVVALRDLLGEDAPLHCDAVQAVGRVPVSFRALGAVTLSLSAHKFHGPKGVGALLVRRGLRLRPMLAGGHQQMGLRPGTEPVALAVGLARALQIADRDGPERLQKVERLRGRLLAYLEREAAPVVLNGPRAGGIPHTLNLSFPGCRGDALLIRLDLDGVACSTGSACSSGSLLPSPVLQAMGVPDAVLHSAMRFSLSAMLTEEDVDEAGRRIARAVRALRESEER